MLYDGSIIEKAGRQYRINLENDCDSGPPWENDCGTGFVSEWTTRAKKPCEWIVSGSRGHCRFYDVKASMAKAKDDGWGLNDKAQAELEERLGRPPTKGDIAAEAVRLDFERHRGWCADEWNYIGVVVTDVTDDLAAEMDYSHALWGVESECDDYIAEIAEQLIADIESEHAEEHAAEAVEQARREAFDADLVPGAYDIDKKLQALLAEASRIDLVVTVERKSLWPPAMGKHIAVPVYRPALHIIRERMNRERAEN